MIEHAIPDIELRLLSVMIKDPFDTIKRLNPHLTAQHFSNPNNAALFELVSNQWRLKQPMDMLCLADKLAKEGVRFPRTFISDIESTETLLGYSVCFLAYVNQYSTMIIERSIRKELSELLKEIDPLNPQIDPFAIKNHIVEKIKDINPDYEASSDMTYLDAYKKLLDTIDKVETQGFQGILTGFPVLDQITGGIPLSYLLIIAGVANAGKTFLGLNLAKAASDQGKNILFFSLETTEEGLADKSLPMIEDQSCQNAIGWHDIKDLQKPPTEYNKDRLIKKKDRLKQMAQLAANTRITFPKSTNDFVSIEGAIQKYISKGQVDVVVIDHLHLMTFNGNQDIEDVNHITRSLKQLSLRYKIPIILLAQLRKTTTNTKRSSVEYSNDDIKGSNSIVTDADGVILLYKDRRSKEDDQNSYTLEISKWRDMARRPSVYFNYRTTNSSNIPTITEKMFDNDDEDETKASKFKYNTGF